MSSLSPDVRRFILKRIPSVPHLETLLLMHGQPSQRRTAAEVGARLYVAEDVADTLLRWLCDAGLLACDDDAEYRFVPGDPVRDDLLVALADAYAADLVGVTKLIHDAGQGGARRSTDAFKPGSGR